MEGNENRPEATLESKAAQDLLAKYWAHMYVINGICGICVQTGFITLVNGSKRPCICPGGRVIAERMQGQQWK